MWFGHLIHGFALSPLLDALEYRIGMQDVNTLVDAGYKVSVTT